MYTTRVIGISLDSECNRSRREIITRLQMYVHGVSKLLSFFNNSVCQHFFKHLKLFNDLFDIVSITMIV